MIDSNTAKPRLRRMIRLRPKRRFLPIALLLSVAILLPAVARAQQTVDARPVESLDRVIAVVNDEVITRRELDRAVGIARSRLAQRSSEAAPPPPPEQLQQQVLESLVLDHAQTQYARNTGLQISDAQVDRAVESVAQQNRLSIGQLRDRLKDDGVNFAEFRDDIRSQIVRSRLRESEVEARIRISDADIDAWLAEQAGRGMQTAEVDVGQLFLALPENPTDDQVAARRGEADELLRQLRDSADFAALVASRSESKNEVDKAGSLGWRTLDQLPRLFADAVAGLEVGQVSDVVRSPAGLHILKLLDKKGGASDLDKPIKQTKVRHILIRPGGGLSENEILRRLESVRERVRAGQVEFAAMARQYSVDGSAGNGGDLGWVYQGDTVPEFERAMDALAPDDISEPVRSQFGFHLIQVLDRRQDRASDERRRQLARQALVEQRAEAAWREWLDELRARTYVEYRLEQ